MKTKYVFFLLPALFPLLARADLAPPPSPGDGPQTNLAAILQNIQPDGSLPVTIIERAQNSRTMQHVRVQTNRFGHIILRTNLVHELASGMNYADPTTGNLIESSPRIVLTNNGAMAIGAPHTVQFSADINTVGAVALQTPDNKTLRTRVMGIAYFDYQSGQTVLIAELTNSIGQVISETEGQVIYTNAFDGVKADIKYSYSKAGLEQDIILRERPPLPEDFSLNPDSTRLEVWTEFFDAPQPVRHQRLRKRWLKAKVDYLLSFGAMQIGHGSAFGTQGEMSTNRHGISIDKEWVESSGRTFLVEDVSFRWLTPHLRQLPAWSQGHASIDRKSSDGALYVLSTNRLLPKINLAMNPKKSPAQIALASLDTRHSTYNQPGVVLDFSVVNSIADFRFQGDSTYLITNSVILSGTTTIEGGSVIKFSLGSSIEVLDSIKCLTGPYRPAVLTAAADNTVGESISNGVPLGAYIALQLDNGGDLQYLRFLYHTEAIYSLHDYTVKHCQFVHCTLALMTDNANFTAQNILMSDVYGGFDGHFYHGTVTHLTCDQAASIAYDLDFAYHHESGVGPPSSSITLINSLLTGVTSESEVPIYRDHVQELADGSGVFQTVGAGSYYLLNNSPYRGGTNCTTSIDATLLAALRTKTTYPPVVRAQTDLGTNNIVLSPEVQRETDAPDLGYAYDPIDFAFAAVAVTNGITVSVAPGTVIATFATNTPAYGLRVSDGSQLLCQGSATNPVRFVEYNTVQEQASSSWTNPAYSMITDDFQISPAAALNFRFTDWSSIAQDAPHLRILTSPFTLQDCQMHGGQFLETALFSITNCLFERVQAWLHPDGDAVPVLRNTLFYWGQLDIATTVTNAVVKDNLFHGTNITSDFGGSFDGGHNAFVTNCSRLTPTNPSDIVLTDTDYQVGPLGNYYYPTNGGMLSTLINAGSTTAEQVGLFHYTVSTNLIDGLQIKETNSVVDIGFHLVAVDSNGRPIDTDGDGLPDYFENKAGDGTYNAVDLSDWRTGDTDDDGVSDYTEYIQGRNPRINDATVDTGNTIRLQIFTPLK